METYVFMDVSGKQAFIYKNNELGLNLYNSFIIKAVTEDLKGEEKDKKLDIKEDIKLPVYLNKYLEKKFAKEYDIVYSGGGNSIVWFNSIGKAKQFIRGYSREVLKAYPGLELYMSLVEKESYDEGEIRDLLYKRIDKIKSQHHAQFRRISYGLEEIDETGRPRLVKLIENNKGIKEIIDFNKIDKSDIKQAKNYLYHKLEKEIEDEQIIITDELKKYKEKKENKGKSYIGVVAIDGNKMGEMSKKIKNFNCLREFSKTIDSLYTEAVADALKEYKESIQQPLYVTPVVLAGDDVCLILEAEHAIEVAKKIVVNIGENTKKYEFPDEIIDKNESLKACAGVAIARYNYPFFEAVTTAETLCHGAKEAIYKTKDNSNGSFINWDVVQKQVAATREYEDYVEHGTYKENFHVKPLRIDQANALSEGIFSFNSFWKLVQEIKDTQEISSSTLEEIKKVIYSGKEEYDLLFEMKQTEGIEALNKLVEENYCNSKNTLMLEANDDKKIITYILNDVIDILPFLNERSEEC